MGSHMFTDDVVVVGGGGHVGLPLSIALASRGLRVTAFDIDAATVEQVAGGTMPFREEGAEPVLRDVLSSGTFSITDDPSVVSDAEYVVVVVGTPVDAAPQPGPRGGPRGRPLRSSRTLRDGQVVVLRSTVYPGVTRRVEQLVADDGPVVDVAFCPERIAEGRAMTELFELPQIVAARDLTAPCAVRRSSSASSPSPSSSSSRRRPSSPSSSPTPGATSSSPPPTSSS